MSAGRVITIRRTSDRVDIGRVLFILVLHDDLLEQIVVDASSAHDAARAIILALLQNSMELTATRPVSTLLIRAAHLETIEQMHFVVVALLIVSAELVAIMLIDGACGSIRVVSSVTSLLRLLRIDTLEVDLVTVLVLLLHGHVEDGAVVISSWVIETCAAAALLKQELAQVRGSHEALAPASSIVSAHVALTVDRLSGGALHRAMLGTMTRHRWCLIRVRVKAATDADHAVAVRNGPGTRVFRLL